ARALFLGLLRRRHRVRRRRLRHSLRGIPGATFLMAYEFKLPDLGEGLTEGEVARWLVTEGQEIAEDEPLVEIATDKTTVEIPSPAGGTVTQILVEEGAVVPVGTVLVVIGGDGAGPTAAEDQPRAAPAPAVLETDETVDFRPGARPK